MDVTEPTFWKQTATSSVGVSPDAYIYTISQIEPPNRFLAISSDDSLASFEADQATLRPLNWRGNHHEGITCLASFTDHSGSHTYVTVGRNGAVRAFTWPAHEQQWEVIAPNGKPISALTVTDSSEGLLVAAGTVHSEEGLGEVGVFVWTKDRGSATKSPPTLMRSYTESHTDTITSLAFNSQPAQSARLLSASTDGLIHLFDLNVADEDDAVEVTFNNRSAVNHACLLPNNMVCAISHDEQLSIHTLGEEPALAEGESKPGPWDLRDWLHCDYAISLTPGTDGETVMLAAGANKPETTQQPWVGIFKIPVVQQMLQAGAQLDVLPIRRLDGAHGEEVVRHVHQDNSDESTVLTCGEDGQVRLWAPVEMIASSSITKKKSEKDKVEKGRRYRPY